jgi:hypothetical protein
VTVHLGIKRITESVRKKESEKNEVEEEEDEE